MPPSKSRDGSRHLSYSASALLFPAAIIDPQAKDLTPQEKELVWLFRQLGNEDLKGIAVSQLRVLAESAIQSGLKAQWEEIGKEADERGIKLP